MCLLTNESKRHIRKKVRDKIEIDKFYYTSNKHPLFNKFFYFNFSGID